MADSVHEDARPAHMEAFQLRLLQLHRRSGKTVSLNQVWAELMGRITATDRLSAEIIQ